MSALLREVRFILWDVAELISLALFVTFIWCFAIMVGG